jgi:hypothetical protein
MQMWCEAVDLFDMVEIYRRINWILWTIKDHKEAVDYQLQDFGSDGCAA